MKLEKWTCCTGLRTAALFAFFVLIGASSWAVLSAPLAAATHRRGIHRHGREDLDAHRPDRLAHDFLGELFLAAAAEQLARALLRQDQEDRVAYRRHVGFHLFGEDGALELESDADLRVAVDVLVGQVDDEGVERQEDRNALRVGLGQACAASGPGASSSPAASAAACAAFFFRTQTPPPPAASTTASAAATMIRSFFLPRLNGTAPPTAAAVSAVTAGIDGSPRRRARCRTRRRGRCLEGNYRNRGRRRSGDKACFCRAERPTRGAPAQA